MITRGFTLVEFLIIVAIILILVVVAFPSFEQAHTLSTMGLARQRMEAMNQALHMHRVDWGSVPADFNDSFNTTIAYRVRSATNPVCSRFPDANFATDGGLTFFPVDRARFYANNIHCPLTSPVAYVSYNETIDPFSDGTVPFGYDSREISAKIEYGVFSSAGPDKVAGDWIRGAGPDYNGDGWPNGLPYDPTNGTESRGEFWGAVSDCVEGASPTHPCMADVEFVPRLWFPPWDSDINLDDKVDAQDLMILMQDWCKVSGP
jgi:type II secretory pathway pseudopilin PulG